MRVKIYLSAVSAILLGIAVPSQARVDSLTVGVDVGLDMDHRTNQGPGASGSTVDYNTIFTTPSLSFKSDDIKDGIGFTYAPSFRYDLEGRGTTVNQMLNLSAQRSLAKEWQIRISDLYVKSNDSTQTANVGTTTGDTTGGGTSNVSGDQISNELGRRAFWTNTTSLVSNYTYLQDSVVTLGYTYSLLRNDGTSTENYQDYDKQSGMVSVSYRFRPEWKATLGGEYIRGLFGTQVRPTIGSQGDLSEYHGNMSLESYIFSKNILSVSYGYSGTIYDDPIQKNSDINNVTVGWKRDVTPHMSFDLGGGPSYAQTEGQNAVLGYNAHANLNYAIEHGQFGIGAVKTYSQDNFTGTSTGGSISSWTLRGNFNYQLYKDLSTAMFVSYADQDHMNSMVGTSGMSSYQEKIYSTGATMQYSFWRWYTLTAGYTFSRQEATSNQIGGYDDNRIYMTLGAQRELFRW